MDYKQPESEHEHMPDEYNQTNNASENSMASVEIQEQQTQTQIVEQEAYRTQSYTSNAYQTQRLSPYSNASAYKLANNKKPDISEPPPGTSPVQKASINMFNSVIGVGIVTMPKAFMLGGPYACYLLAILSCLMVYYTSIIMIKCVEKDPSIRSYTDLANKGIGKHGGYMVSTFIFFLMIGAMIIYNILFRTLLSGIISDITSKTFEYDQALLLGIGIVVLLPLSLLKNMSKLAWSSLLSTTTVFLIIIILCIRAGPYNKAMRNQTPSNMFNILQDLSQDRSYWLCNLAKASEDDKKSPQEIDYDPYDQNIFGNNSFSEVANQRLVYNKLAKSKGCSTPVNQTKVHEDLDAITVEPSCTDQYGYTLNCSSQCVVCHNFSIAMKVAYARKMYNDFSLNDEGRKHFKFSLNQFSRIGILIAIGTFSSAFISQQTVFPIFFSLKHRNQKNWAQTMSSSFFVIFTACMILSSVGYFYGEYQIGGLVFEKYVSRFVGLKSPDQQIIIGNLFLISSIALTYPMQLYFGRITMIHLVGSLLAHFGQYDNTRPEPNNWMFYSCTGVMFVSTLLIGMFVDNPFFVYSVFGSLVASPLIYCFPVQAWYGVIGGMRKTISKAFRSREQKGILEYIVIPLAVITFGILTTFIATIFTITEEAGFTKFGNL